jgi:hypothetical protein
LTGLGPELWCLAEHLIWLLTHDETAELPAVMAALERVRREGDHFGLRLLAVEVPLRFIVEQGPDGARLAAMLASYAPEESRQFWEAAAAEPRKGEELLAQEEDRERGQTVATVIASEPVPVAVVEYERSATRLDDLSLYLPLADALGGLAELIRLPGCRGVPFDRLAEILAHGLDVEPTTAPIFVNLPSKALEDGGDEKVIEVFNFMLLEQTYRRVPVDTPAARLSELRATYPTCVTQNDGGTLWLSRLPADDPRVATSYESDLARWIPGDPWEALRMIVVVGAAGCGLVERARRVVRAEARFALEGA